MVSKASVKAVVKKFKKCQSIELPSAHWLKSELDVSDTWGQVGMAITYYKSRNYLSLINSGPMQFAIWHYLIWQDAASIIHHLETLLCEHGPPTEILIDNDTAFHSKLFRHFLNEWIIGPWCSDTPEASSSGPEIDSLKNTSVDKSSEE